MSRWNKRFMASTRGRIVGLLRGTNRTVNELAEALDLTDNAVRAHLSTLERDGLVQQSGTRRGVRKPHYAYHLTPEADHLFPKAYGALLDQLLAVLGDELAPEAMDRVLREVGHRIAAPCRAEVEGRAFEDRLQAALRLLSAIGGLAEVEAHDGELFIRGDSCPLATVVAGHPQVCRLAETMLADVLGTPVHEQCRKGEAPQCCFAVREPVR